MRLLYDYVVIGKGLMGASAAKYLSQLQGHVAIIGPDELADLSQAAVFASHYDQARVQRQIGLDEVWTLLNKQSAAAYQKLQTGSGIYFHDAVGCLYVQPEGADSYLKNAQQLAKQFHVDCTFFHENQMLRQAFPDYHFPATSNAMMENRPSGIINPRLLIQAQLEVFKKNGGMVFNETVSQIAYGAQKADITTASGNLFSAKKLLLAPGSFANFLPLPENKKLSLKLKSETVILAKVGESEAKRLSALPSLLYEINNEILDGIYLIKPVKYPDGNYYIKMGCNFPADIYFDNLAEIKKWFLHGDSERHCPALKSALTKILPTVVFEDFITKRCIITRTPHGKPYIGHIANNVFVATGGNGYGAMCSDALGKIASHLVVNEVFTSEYPANAFIPVFV